MASGIPTRRAAAPRRADENARPPLLRAPTTRSKTIPTLTSTSASTTASAVGKPSALPTSTGLPVLKRTNTASTLPDAKDALAKKRAALGEVTNGKGKTAERRPLASAGGKVEVNGATRRSRVAAVEVKEKEVKEVAQAAKRKAAAPSRLNSRSRSTTASTSVENVAAKADPSAVKDEPPARKRRKTSSPALVEDEGHAERTDADEEDDFEAEEREEVLLSSGADGGVSCRSPKLKGRAKDEGWTDLDAEDEGDPAMVSEYVVDAFRYMMAIEKSSLPSPTYMDKQVELQWKMRTILMDWLIEVHSKFRLLPETLFIAVNLVDRFLSQRVVSLVKFQLVGLTALFIAAKYEEVICPSVTHFLHMTDGGYGVEEILKAERYMLSTLNFDLSYPNPLHFLRRISKADGYDIQTRTVAKFLIEISCVEHRLLGFPPSLLAAAGMWLARLCLDRGEWTPNLVHYSEYSVEELLEPAQIMLNYILSVDFDDNSCFYKKYASKKHMKSSVFVRHWAIDRWPESAAGVSSDIGKELELELAADE